MPVFWIPFTVLWIAVELSKDISQIVVVQLFTVVKRRKSSILNFLSRTLKCLT